VEREVRELLLAAVASGDVGGDPDHGGPVAARHRRVGDLEDRVAQVHQLADLLTRQRAAGGCDDLGLVGVHVEQRLADELAGLEAQPGERLAL
jgi:hypothetical protein